VRVRQVTTDDIARAVFVAAEEDGEPVPDLQSRRLVAEIEALTSEREIHGFATATADGGGRFVIALIGDEGYLLRFSEGLLRITFLGNLPGLRYEEHFKAIGGMRGFAGEPWVRLQLEHERLPDRLTIEAEDWSVSLLEALRASFRSWAARA
jgi:hypothetical protein